MAHYGYRYIKGHLQIQPRSKNATELNKVIITSYNKRVYFINLYYKVNNFKTV